MAQEIPGMAVPPRNVISPRRGTEVNTLLDEILKISAVPSTIIDKDAAFNAGFPLQPPSKARIGTPIQLLGSNRVTRITPLAQGPPVISVEALAVLVEGLTQRDIDVIEGRPVYDAAGNPIDLTGLVPLNVPKKISEGGVQGQKRTQFYSRQDLTKILSAMNRRAPPGQSSDKASYAKIVQSIYDDYLKYQQLKREATSLDL